MKEFEKRTLICDEPRIGFGHANIDPAIMDSVETVNNNENKGDSENE